MQGPVVPNPQPSQCLIVEVVVEVVVDVVVDVVVEVVLTTKILASPGHFSTPSSTTNPVHAFVVMSLHGPSVPNLQSSHSGTLATGLVVVVALVVVTSVCGAVVVISFPLAHFEKLSAHVERLPSTNPTQYLCTL
jgi:hypothetical protein